MIGTVHPTVPAVVVAGDAFVDLTSTSTGAGRSCYEPHPGGSCLNVAVGLGRLGVATALLARISTDAFGEQIRSHLSESGVLDTYLIPAIELTGLGIADVVDGVARYAFHTQGAADRGLIAEHLPSALPARALLHVGSIALAQEPQATTLHGLLERESGRRIISLDPNIRPDVIVDRDAYLARLDRWIALSDIVKVSDEDLEWLYPGERPEEVAARWQAAGVALVMVTLGPDGAWAAGSHGTASVKAPRVQVVDTVGAGDAFMAGALAALLGGGPVVRGDLTALDSHGLQRLLTRAAGVAALTCTRAGAQPPFVHDLAWTDG